MKCQINSFFEPDLLWAGEINRQTIKLERRLGVLWARRANLECSLWRDRDSKPVIALTLDLEGVQFYGKAEDSSEIAATRKAFEDINRQLEAHLNRTGDQYPWFVPSAVATSAPYFYAEQSTTPAT